MDLAMQRFEGDVPEGDDPGKALPYVGEAKSRRLPGVGLRAGPRPRHRTRQQKAPI